MSVTTPVTTSFSERQAGLLQPVRGDGRLQDATRHQLDRLDQRVVDDRDRLRHAVGLTVAA